MVGRRVMFYQEEISGYCLQIIKRMYEISFQSVLAERGEFLHSKHSIHISRQVNPTLTAIAERRLLRKWQVYWGSAKSCLNFKLFYFEEY